MADTQQAHPGTVTTTDRVREALTAWLQPNRGLLWLADEMIRIAQYADAFHLEGQWDEALGYRQLFDMSTSPPTLLDLRVGVFRSLLARTMVLGQHETGLDLSLYGDRFSLIRATDLGPTRLEFEVGNTPACQRLRITRHPITMADVRRLTGRPEPAPQPSPAS